MNATLRRSFLLVHRWTGLTLGLVLVFIAATGLAMIFRPQLEPAVERHLLEVAPCTARMPLDALTANARAAHPKVAIDRIFISGDSSASTLIRFADQQGFYLDPCTGAVLGQKHLWGGIFGTIEQLHRFRFVDDGAVANVIGGTAAFILALVFVIGGLVVWWPATVGAFKRSVKLLPKLTGRAFELNLHRTTGFYASLIILAAAITSLPLAFKWVRYAVYSATSSSMPAPRPQSDGAGAGAKRLPLETLWQRAQSLVSDPAKAELLFPRAASDPVEISLLARDAPHAKAVSTLYLDAYSGKVLDFDPYAHTSAGNKIYLWSKSLHRVEVGGLFGQLLLFTGLLGVPVLGYTGISSYLRRRIAESEDKTPGRKVRVDRIQPETAEIKSFELVSVTEAPLPAFTPGSHIDVHIDDGLVRQYSLCNGPTEEGRYVIAVKREPASRGGSRSMHERIAEGDVLTISAPRNHFPIDPSARHHLLLAGGIGITPLLAMARHLQNMGASFHLQYFTRSVEHTAFHALLSQPEFRSKVTFHYALEPESLHTYLHKLLWHRQEDAHLYVCGPRAFMDLVETTASATWPPETVHTEYFSANPQAFSGPREAFEVTLALTGGTHTVPADKSIVRALAECGIEIPTSCEQGVCGTCLTGLLEGEADHRDAFLTEEERKAGDKIMPCVSRAKGKYLVLDI